jgi:hypothetical protein
MQMKNTYTDFVGKQGEGHLVEINECGDNIRNDSKEVESNVNLRGSG